MSESSSDTSADDKIKSWNKDWNLNFCKLESWYQDWNRDSQILSLDIETGIETLLSWVLISILESRLLGLQSWYLEWYRDSKIIMDPCDRDSCKSRCSSPLGRWLISEVSWVQSYLIPLSSHQAPTFYLAGFCPKGVFLGPFRALN